MNNSYPQDEVELASYIGRLAALLAMFPHLPGERLTLTRVDPAEPGVAATVALYRFLESAEIDPADQHELNRWMWLVHCLAITRGRHNPNLRAGEVLANIWYSDHRLAALLAPRAQLALPALPKLARLLVARQAEMNWLTLAALVLFTERDEPRAEQARLEIARSFASARYNNLLQQHAPGTVEHDATSGAAASVSRVWVDQANVSVVTE